MKTQISRLVPFGSHDTISVPEIFLFISVFSLRAVVESVHKLDVIIGGKSSYREVFKPENISLRNK